MKSPIIDKCYICGTEFDTNEDECPYCEWFYSGAEDKLPPDEENPYNGISVNEAKEKYAKGLNIWGKPLPKVRPKN